MIDQLNSIHFWPHLKQIKLGYYKIERRIGRLPASRLAHGIDFTNEVH